MFPELWVHVGGGIDTQPHDREAGWSSDPADVLAWAVRYATQQREGNLRRERDEARAALEPWRQEVAAAMTAIGKLRDERDEARAELEIARAELEINTREWARAEAASMTLMNERDEARAALAAADAVDPSMTDGAAYMGLLDAKAASALIERVIKERDEAREALDVVLIERNEYRAEAKRLRERELDDFTVTADELDAALDRAEKAERERDKARAALEPWRQECADAMTAIGILRDKRDEARAEVKRLRESVRMAREALGGGDD